MVEDTLYHCIVGDKLMLVYCDSQKIMHCYEVEETRIVEGVRACANYDDAAQLLEQIGANSVNKVIKQVRKDKVSMGSNNDAADVYAEYSDRHDDSASDPTPSDTSSESQPQSDPTPSDTSSESQPSSDTSSESQSRYDTPSSDTSSESQSRYDTPPSDTSSESQPSSDYGQSSGTMDAAPESSEGSAPDGARSQNGETRDRSIILIGIKPIMTYVTATLTQLATSPKITIKSRGKRITQAVDVSQMIVKRMNTVGYKISDIRIDSDSFTGDDGRDRKISTMEIDITKA